MERNKRFILMVIAILTAALATNAKASLVASWSFNEGEGGGVYDSSGNSNTGIRGGWGTMTAGAPDFTTDTPGDFAGEYALEFNGADGVLVADSASLDVTRFTIETWVKLYDTPDNYDAIIAKGTAFQILFSSSKKPYIAATIGGTQYTAYALTTLSLNEWHYLAATYDGTELKFYVDGTTPAQVTSIVGSATVNTTRLAIGANGNISGGYFNGVIDEVRIHDTALSGSQLYIPEPCTLLLLASGLILSVKKR